MNDIVVLPGGEKLALDWKLSDPERFQRRLKAKHAENAKDGPGERAHCLCIHQGSYLELQIRERGHQRRKEHPTAGGLPVEACGGTPHQAAR